MLTEAAIISHLRESALKRLKSKASNLDLATVKMTVRSTNDIIDESLEPVDFIVTARALTFDKQRVGCEVALVFKCMDLTKSNNTIKSRH